MLDIKEFRDPPEGVYRLIELDARRQSDGRGGHPDESQFTTHIGDYTDWDEAMRALKEIPNRHCRRQLWGARGILGVYGKDQVFVLERFR